MVTRQQVASGLLSVFLPMAWASGAGRTLTSVTDGDWDDPSSWIDEGSGMNSVPTRDDRVVINSHTIVMTSPEEVAEFDLKDGTLDLGRHELAADVRGSWGRGVITGPGGFNNYGDLQLRDTPTKTLYGTLNNYRLVTHDEGNLHLAYESKLVNRPDSVYDLVSDADITGLARYDASPAFINLGLFRKSHGVTTSRVEIVFQNYGGTVEVDSGTLSLVGTGGQGSVSSSGVFRVHRNAVLDIGGNNVNVLNGTHTGGGEGRIEFRQGTVRLGTDFGDSVFAFQGKGFFWTGGSMEPVLGGLVNAGRFTLEGDSVKNLGAGPEFKNRGELIHRGTGAFNIEYGGACRIQKGASYKLQSDAGITSSGGKGPKPEFSNAGFFGKTAGVGTSTIHAPFSNNGEVEVDSGMLSFADTFVQEGGTTRLAGGDLSSVTPLEIHGGDLCGNGRVFASVHSSGRLAPGSSPGRMVIHGDYVQGPKGALELEVAGPEPILQYDQLHVFGQVSLQGKLTVKLLDNYVPEPGASFDLVTCRGLSRRFAETDLPDLPADRAWDLRYEPTGLQLVVVRHDAP